MPRRAQIRVCVAGVTGWTGSAVAAAVRDAADLDLVSGVSRSDADNHSSVAEALDAVEADVLVDYTHAEAVRENVSAAIERGVNVVVGSSGLSADDYSEIAKAARDHGVGVVAAGNFSITAAVLLKAAVDAARHLDAWEVIDYASDTKPDAPSGTARELAERLAEVRAPAQPVPIDDVLGQREARGAPVAGSQVTHYVSRASSSRRRSSSPHRGSASASGTMQATARTRTSPAPCLRSAPSSAGRD